MFAVSREGMQVLFVSASDRRKGRWLGRTGCAKCLLVWRSYVGHLLSVSPWESRCDLEACYTFNIRLE